MKLKRLFIRRLMNVFGEKYWDMSVVDRLRCLKAILPTKFDYQLEEMR